MRQEDKSVEAASPEEVGTPSQGSGEPKTARRRSGPVFGDYIRQYYGIHIEKGMHVESFDGRRGVIVGATNYVQVKLEGHSGKSNFHPDSLSYPALGIKARTA